MTNIGHKQLLLPTLFYDAIFIFTLSRMISGLAFAEYGVIGVQNVLAVAILLVCSWAVWAYQVVYAVRSHQRPWVDLSFLAVDMALIMWLGTTLTTFGAVPTSACKVVTALLLLSLALQYWFALRADRQRWLIITPLLVGALISLGDLLCTNVIGAGIIYAVGVLIAACGALFLRKTGATQTGHFATVHWRLAEITVLALTLGIMEMTSDPGMLTSSSVVFMVAMILLLVGYLLVFEQGIDVGAKRTALGGIIIHLPIVASVLLMANTSDLFTKGRLTPCVFAVWTIGLLAIYIVALGGYLAWYKRPTVDLAWRRTDYFVWSLVLFAIYGAVTAGAAVFFLGGMSLYLVANNLYLWRFILNGGTPPRNQANGGDKKVP